MGLGNLMKHAWIARLYPLTISLRELLVRSQKGIVFFPQEMIIPTALCIIASWFAARMTGRLTGTPKNIVNIAGFSYVFLVISYMFYQFLLIGWQKRTDPEVHGILEIQQVPCEKTQETPVDPAIQPPDLIGIHLLLQFTLYFSIGCFMWFEHGFTMFYANLVRGLNRMNYLMGCASLPLMNSVCKSPSQR